MTIVSWREGVEMNRLMVFAVVALVLLSGKVFSEDWEAVRVRSAFAFAKAEELTEKKPDVGDSCPDCFGTGKRGDGRIEFKCPTCNGSGKKTNRQSTQAASAETVTPEDPELRGVRFTATWCGPCRTYETKEEPRVSIPFEVVDVDTEYGKRQIARCGIRNIPAFQLIDRQLSTVLIRIDEFKTAEQMNKLIDEARILKQTRRRLNEANIVRATVRIRCDVSDTRSWGSGTIIKESGSDVFVLTAAHVVEGNDIWIEVVNQEPGTEYRAAVVTSNAATDLALLKFQSRRRYNKLDHFGVVRTCGDTVTLSGYPEGGSFTQYQTVTMEPTTADGVSMLVTEGDVQTGYSGGPLSIEGTIIGVVSVVNRNAKETWYADSDAIAAIIASIK
jgi:S1-C subfamily serine protease